MAPGKNTVSLAEKKARILRFFQEEHTVYNMKELEKYIPKKCGISSMLVKELVQKIIDEDGIINVEKCGNINVYWSFKNQIRNKLNSDARNVLEKIDKAKNNIEQCRATYSKLSEGAKSESRKGEKGWKRSTQLARLKERQKFLRELKIRHGELAKNNWTPKRLEEERKRVLTEIQSAMITLDNIQCVTCHLSATYCVPLSDLEAELEIPQEFSQFETILDGLKPPSDRSFE